MKIKVIEKSYKDVMELSVPKHKKPKKIDLFFRTLIKLLSVFKLKKHHVKYNEVGMDRIGKKQPCLVLMNHSSFVDMEIAANYLYPRPFSTICTTDGFVGMSWLMHTIGCIPTPKFVSDISLIKDMSYALNELKSNVLMYPEACYSFDGTSSTLSEGLGKLVKLLGVPVVTMITHGAFTREPLYNMLKQRNVDISVDVTYLITPEELNELSDDEINEKIHAAFSFDAFKWQKENEVKVSNPDRADGLERVLYKCPHCLHEGTTVGKDTTLTCRECGKTYELTELGQMRAVDGETEFEHIPDWFAWERNEARAEIERGEYLLDIDVDVYMLVDYKGIYHVGDGHLTHSTDGFHLTGSDGELDYKQPPLSCHSINSDYYWYEIGDMISIGNRRHLFYCFPKDQSIPVAKTKLAAEELYKIKRADKRAHDNASEAQSTHA